MPRSRPSRRSVLGLAGAAALVAWAPVGCGAARRVPSGLDPTLPLPSGTPLRRGRVVDVREQGARGDGTTDDTAAVVRALAAAGGSDPATVLFPAGRYLLHPATPLAPGAGVTLAGEPGRSTLLVDGRPEGAGPAEAPQGNLTVLLRVQAPDVTVDGLVIERVADMETVLVQLGAADRFTLSRTVLAGHTDALDTFCHGVQVGISGGVTSNGLRLADSVLSTTQYGLYQANTSTAVTLGVDVSGCTFAGGTNTDLEFNSPRGSFRRITVAGCTFRDNDSEGFAVGLAYCAQAVVRGCTVSNYRMEAVHVEDFTDDVLVEGNTFTACGLREFAHVQIISGASRVVVRGNTHDATMNTRAIPIVGALRGGDGLTAGGRPQNPPSAVTVTGNTMRLGAAVRAVALDDVAGGTITGNRVSGPGARDPARVFAVRGGSGITVAGNTVRERM